MCDTFADANADGNPGTGSSGDVQGRPSLHSVWPTMLFELRSLAADFRPEVRSRRWLPCHGCLTVVDYMKLSCARMHALLLAQSLEDLLLLFLEGFHNCALCG